MARPASSTIPSPLAHTQQRARAVCRKLRYHFPDCGRGRLCFAVIECAIMDAIDSQGKSSTSHHTTAVNYLRNDLYHAQLCGVDPDWIRLILAKAELKI